MDYPSRTRLLVSKIFCKSKMDSEDFRKWGKHMVDFICQYLDELPQRRVIPDVEPGYLPPLIPKEAPEEPEEWPAIFQDITKFILPGSTVVTSVRKQRN
ncbi:unnamed protein product [Protopolystoma xenopodis]|uniref:Uncharacterized protein n=1 Tax=Protopolystoma xenopodis TaxID=117903 RepID=A0A3S5AW96_9PLAT|nr:unnamed protein product [Protopolystoma xenopodis]